MQKGLAKTPTINLVDFRESPKLYHKGPEKFLIESMSNTIEYHAGTYLGDRDVKALIQKGWTVKIRAPRNSDY